MCIVLAFFLYGCAKPEQKEVTRTENCRCTDEEYEAMKEDYHYTITNDRKEPGGYSPVIYYENALYWYVSDSDSKLVEIPSGYEEVGTVECIELNPYKLPDEQLESNYERGASVYANQEGRYLFSKSHNGSIIKFEHEKFIDNNKQ